MKRQTAIKRPKQSADVVSSIYSRLHRIGGQVAAVERMIEHKRDCYEILQQVVAAREALDRVAIQILEEEARGCVRQSNSRTGRKDFERLVGTLFKIVK